VLLAVLHALLNHCREDRAIVRQSGGDGNGFAVAPRMTTPFLIHLMIVGGVPVNQQ